MFYQAIVNNILKSNSVAGVEVIFLPEGGYTFHVIVLGKKKSQVNILASFQNIDNIDALKNSLPKAIPVMLVLNGKGIIHKKVAYNVSDTDKTLLQKVLPNANSDEFYIQKELQSKDSAFISVMRKNQIDQLLNELQLKGITTISCSMGPFCLNIILPLINIDPDLKIASYLLNIKDHKIENFQTSSETTHPSKITIGDNAIQADFAISFAVAFQYFISNALVRAEIPSLQQSSEEYKQARIFKVAGWAVLTGFLLVLMINYFLFNHYWTQKNTLSIKVSHTQAELVIFEKLNTEVNEKEIFFEQTGMLEPSRTSYYSDCLAMDLPASIQLTQLHISPLVKKTNTEEKIAFVTKTINISGTCEKSNELNNWIKIIKNKEWVNEVKLINYSQDKSKDAGEFKIELKIK